jgi:hypothetical protein
VSYRRIDTVKVVTDSAGVIEMPWKISREILDVLRSSPAAAALIAKFEAKGTSAPITLTPGERVILVGAIDKMTEGTFADDLPSGLVALREALHNHSGAAGS